MKPLSRGITLACSFVLLLAALVIPYGSAKYIARGEPKELTVVWSTPITVTGAYNSTAARSQVLTVTEGVNEGWYGFIIWGGSGGGGQASGGNFGNAGVVKGVVYLDAGTGTQNYTLAAGGCGSNATAYSNGSYLGGGMAYSDSGSITGGGGGGLSGIFKGSVAQGSAIAVAGGGGGGGGGSAVAVGGYYYSAQAGNGGHAAGSAGGGIATVGTAVAGGSSGSDPSLERGAGGGVNHTGSGTRNGGGYCNRVTAGYSGPGGPLKGGNATSTPNSTGCGGGGAGWEGGGAGGVYQVSASGFNCGGGGGGSSFIIGSNGGESSRAFSGTADILVANTNTTHGFGAPLNPGIATYLNSLAVPRSNVGSFTNQHNGVVVLAYLGRNDPTGSHFAFNW